MDQPAHTPTTNAPTHTEPLAGRRPGSVTVFLLVTLIALAADLGLKTYAFNHVAGQPVVLDLADTVYHGVPFHDPVTLVPGILNLQLTANTGAIFGMGKGSRWVFVAVSLLAVGFVGRVFWCSPANARVFHTALALIMAGALGNLYDRIRFAAVRDMLHLFPGVDLPWNLSWPDGSRGLYPWIFNLADAALLLGVATVVFITWKTTPQPPADGKAPG